MNFVSLKTKSGEKEWCKGDLHIMLMFLKQGNIFYGNLNGAHFSVNPSEWNIKKLEDKLSNFSM